MKRLLFTLLLLFILFGISNIKFSIGQDNSSQQEQIEDYLSQGKKLYRQDDYTKAVETWQKILAIDPDHNQAQRYIKRAENKLAETKPPEPVVDPKDSGPQTATQDQQEQIEKLLSDGKSLYRQDKYQEAIAAWQKVTSIDPDNNQAKRYIQRAEGRLKESISPPPSGQKPKPTPQQQTTPKPKQQTTNQQQIEQFLSEGKSLYRQENYQAAIETWQKVLKTDPNNKQAIRYIERAETRLGEKAPAKQQEIRTTPKNEKKPKPEQITLEMERPTVNTPEYLTPEGTPVNLFSLKNCIRTAIDNSLSLNVAKREIKLSKQKVKDARRALFPTASLKWEEIQGSTTGEDFKGREIYLELQQPLYQGGRLVNTLSQATMNMRVAKKNYLKLRNDLVYEVEQAYYILGSTKKIYRELTELIALAKKDHEMAQQEHELKLQREIDYLNVKNQYEDTEYKLISSQKDLTLAYLTLYQTLNINPQELTIDIPDAAPPKQLKIDPDKCENLALEYRPDLAVKKLLLKFNKYGFQIAKSQNRLKIDLTGGAGYKDEVFITEDLNLQPEWYVGVKGSIPIWLNTLEESFVSQDKVPSAGQTTSTDFRSFTTTLRLFDNTGYTSISEAKVNLEKAKDELQKLEKSIKFEIKQDFYEYEKATYQLSAAQTKLQLGEIEQAIVSAHRDLNMASVNDLLRTRIKLWEAKTGYQQAIAGYYTAVAKLNKTMGIDNYFSASSQTSPATDYYMPPPKLDMSLARLDPDAARKQQRKETAVTLAHSRGLGSQETPAGKTKKPYLRAQDLTTDKETKRDTSKIQTRSSNKPKKSTQEEQLLLTKLEKDQAKKEKLAKQEKEKTRSREQKRLGKLEKEFKKEKQAAQKQQAKTNRAELKRLTKLEKELTKQKTALKKEKAKQVKLEQKRQRQLLAKTNRAEKESLDRLEKDFKNEKKIQREEPTPQPAIQAKKTKALTKQTEEKALKQRKQEKTKQQAQQAEKKLLAQKKKELASIKRAETKTLTQLQKDHKKQKQLAKKQKLAAQKEKEQQLKLEQKKQEQLLAQQKKTKQQAQQAEKKLLAQKKKELANIKRAETKTLTQLQKDHKKQKQLAKKQKLAAQKEKEHQLKAGQKKQEQLLAQQKKEKQQAQQAEKKLLAQKKKTAQETEAQATQQEQNLLLQLQLNNKRERKLAAEEEYLLAKALSKKIVEQKKEERKQQKQIAEKRAKKDQPVSKKLTPQEKYQRAYKEVLEKREKEQQKEMQKIIAKQKKENKKEQAAARERELQLKQEHKKEQQLLAKQQKEEKRITKQEQKHLDQLEKEHKKAAQFAAKTKKRKLEQEKEAQRKLLVTKQKEEKERARNEQKLLTKLEKNHTKQQKLENKKKLAAKKKQQQEQLAAKEKVKQEEQKRLAEIKPPEEAPIKKEKVATAKPAPDTPQQKETAATTQAQQEPTTSTGVSAEYQAALKKAEAMLSHLDSQKTSVTAKINEANQKQEEEFKHYFERGKKHYDKEQYSEAIKEWYKALAFDFDNTIVRDYINKAEEKLRQSN